jgi:hypothetical protein
MNSVEFFLGKSFEVMMGANCPHTPKNDERRRPRRGAPAAVLITFYENDSLSEYPVQIIPWHHMRREPLSGAGLA